MSDQDNDRDGYICDFLHEERIADLERRIHLYENMAENYTQLERQLKEAKDDITNLQDILSGTYDNGEYCGYCNTTITDRPNGGHKDNCRLLRALDGGKNEQ